MKLTRAQLKQIIKEEILKEVSFHVTTGGARKRAADLAKGQPPKTSGRYNPGIEIFKIYSSNASDEDKIKSFRELQSEFEKRGVLTPELAAQIQAWIEGYERWIERGKTFAGKIQNIIRSFSRDMYKPENLE